MLKLDRTRRDYTLSVPMGRRYSPSLAEMSGGRQKCAVRHSNVSVTNLRSIKISDLFEKTAIAPAAQGAIERLMQSAAQEWALA